MINFLLYVIFYFVENTIAKREMYANMNYNYKKENLSWFRSIHNLISDFLLFFSPKKEKRIRNQTYIEFQNKLAFKKKRRNNLIKKKKQEYIDNLDSTVIENNVMDFYNSKTDYHTEAIMLPNYHIMTIRKNSDPLLDKENIIDIMIGLKNNENYIAEYGLSSLTDVKDAELIDLNDFEFRFENQVDIERNIELLEILDSDHLKIRNLKDFYSSSIHYQPNFNNLKEKKVLKNGDNTIIYLDREDFEVFDRLPNTYPDKKTLILEDEITIELLLS